MNSRGLIFLAMLACASLIINALLLIVYRSAQEDRENLQAELATLTSSSKAAEVARAVHTQLQQKALNDEQRKNMLLDQAALNSPDIDDADFLDALRGVFTKDSHSTDSTARKPSFGLPHAGGPGNSEAIR